MGKYLQVLVPVSFSKAITHTQQVFRDGYPLCHRAACKRARELLAWKDEYD